MANKQKAWRTQAAAINKRRAEGSKEATARVQKFNTVTMKPPVSWLMQGLMIRAGLYDPLPPVDRLPTLNPNLAAPYGQPVKRNWFSKAWDKAKSLFN